MDTKSFYSTKEAGVLLGVTQIQVIKQINLGRIKAEKIGSQYIVPREAIEEYQRIRRPVGRPKMNREEVVS